MFVNIYVGHSKNYEYVKELYKPIKDSYLNSEYNFIFPHEEEKPFFRTKEILKDCDLMVAEVSYPATGLGIELGYADMYNIPILCIYKKGNKISSSLDYITDRFEQYEESSQIIDILRKHIDSIKTHTIK